MLELREKSLHQERALFMRSFYVLRSLIAPTWGTKNLAFVSSNLEEIQAGFEAELSDPLNLYLFTQYPATLSLRTIHFNEEVQDIYLLPFVKIELPDYPEISFDEMGQVIGFSFKERQHPEKDQLATKLFNRTIYPTQVTVDWEGMGIVPLKRPLLEVGESTRVSEGVDWERYQVLHYGLNDLDQQIYCDDEENWQPIDAEPTDEEFDDDGLESEY